MNTPRRLATWMGIILGATCALLLTEARGSDRTELLKEEFHQNFRLAPGGRVALENLNGRVRINAWEGDEVRVDATKFARSQERLEPKSLLTPVTITYSSEPIMLTMIITSAGTTIGTTLLPSNTPEPCLQAQLSSHSSW